MKQKILYLCQNSFNYSLYVFINDTNLKLYKRHSRIGITNNDIFSKNFYNNYAQSKLGYIQTIDKSSSTKSLNSLSLSTTTWVDFDNNYIYCPSPKVGSTQIKKTFYHYSIGESANEPHGQTNMEISLPKLYGLNFHVFYYQNEWDKVLFKSFNDKTNKYFVRFVFIRDPLKRLMSGFIDKCVITKDKNHCPKKYITNKHDNQTNIKKKFEMFVSNLHDRVFIEKNIYNIDKHFKPQFYVCHMFDLIETFDFILFYDKIHFLSNLKYILKQIILHNEKIRNIDIDSYIEKKYFQDDENVDRLNVKTQEAQLQLLSSYFTKQTAMKALEIYSLDYQWLPLSPPLWIQNLDTE